MIGGRGTAKSKIKPNPHQGPFITFVDVSIAPWLLRLSRVLHPYKGWPLAQPGTRLATWINALEGSEAVGNTLSDPVLYLENYERYAGESPNG